MAILSQLEYRLNLSIDAIIQPLLTMLVEVSLWYAIFQGMGVEKLAGFPRESYLAYALWATFIARITTNWMYEARMMEEIEFGTINSILVRPISFYEYYLSQFMGYKLLTCSLSLFIPLGISIFVGLEIEITRVLAALLLVIYYLIFAHTLSFCFASFAFFMNRAHSLTVGKNIALWVLAGELFPLDLFPEPFGQWIISMPFSAGVFVPVGLITHRFGFDQALSSFISVTVGIALAGLIGAILWSSGRRVYNGTGA